MENVDLMGVDPSFSPLSNSFSVDLISEKFYFNKNIKNINKITFSMNSEYINSFKILNENYNSVYLNINIKFDYVCINNSICYELFSIHKLINICTGNNKFDKRCNIYSCIIDADILNFNENEVDMYMLYGCNLC